jgi:hypothetical protein
VLLARHQCLCNECLRLAVQVLVVENCSAFLSLFMFCSVPTARTSYSLHERMQSECQFEPGVLFHTLIPHCVVCWTGMNLFLISAASFFSLCDSPNFAELLSHVIQEATDASGIVSTAEGEVLP